VGKFAIGFYLGRATFASGFGAAGSLVVLLVWMYYSAQIFLMGAEFTWVYAQEHGSLSERARPGARSVSTRAWAEAAARSARRTEADAAIAATRAAIASELGAAGERRPGVAPR